MIKLKRVYDAPSSGDGKRILIDRLWPRGVKKDDVRIDAWMKDVAPSDGLRKWFGHDPEKWGEFKARFFAELKNKMDLVDCLPTWRGRAGLHSSMDRKKSDSTTPRL